ncbi:carbonic anhydrase family protein [Microvirga sp. VF16]|uniref:carbonic anhydrase family protein n=1 Tax=Microvirga sp. VF16 TaxID=2807101 RepID=UPI00193D3FCD|nr:carbonic anhydrase family protein [Microvirga sp. VF16]QRM28499.1 carbonic anhydrase [Microvirga sp. VF16]
MLSRRHFCCAGVLVGTTAAFDGSLAADACAVQTRERQAALNPDDALAELKAGNERFLSRNMRNCDLLDQVRATAGGQYPFAVVIGCIDSRVPPELVFDQRIGDIFSARIAGNVTEDDVVGSAEFATKLAGAKLIVVLGHSECGAVKGAIDGAELGKLTHLLQRIKPAIAANGNAPGEHTSKNKEFVQQVATTNAKLAAQGLQEDSQVLRDLVAQGELKIVAAMHDVATGRITFME